MGSTSKAFQGCIVEEAEALSFFIGLQMVQEFAPHQMIIEGDCLVVFMLLLEPKSNPPWHIRAIILGF